MKAYYEDDACTIYHGDWRDVLEGGTGEVVVTDPPYGLKARGHWGPNSQNFSRLRGQGKFVGLGGKEYPPIVGDNEPFDPQPLLDLAPHQVFFGANYFADRLPSHQSGWLVWDKRATASGEPVGSNMFGDAELLWVSWQTPVRIFRHLWMGLMRASEIGVHYHPTQKPVALMRWVLSLPGFPPGGEIIDPYMGSGPTLRAAKDLGRKAIGIEIEERYCEIAAQRLAQEVLAL